MFSASGTYQTNIKTKKSRIMLTVMLNTPTNHMNIKQRLEMS